MWPLADVSGNVVCMCGNVLLDTLYNSHFNYRLLTNLCRIRWGMPPRHYLPRSDPFLAKEFLALQPMEMNDSSKLKEF